MAELNRRHSFGAVRELHGYPPALVPDVARADACDHPFAAPESRAEFVLALVSADVKRTENLVVHAEAEQASLQ